jgi:hypothetical protein
MGYYLFNQKKYEQLKAQGLAIRCANRENDLFEYLVFARHLFLNYGLGPSYEQESAGGT